MVSGESPYAISCGAKCTTQCDAGSPPRKGSPGASRRTRRQEEIRGRFHHAKGPFWAQSQHFVRSEWIGSGMRCE